MSLEENCKFLAANFMDSDADKYGMAMAGQPRLMPMNHFALANQYQHEQPYPHFGLNQHPGLPSAFSEHVTKKLHTTDPNIQLPPAVTCESMGSLNLHSGIMHNFSHPSSSIPMKSEPQTDINCLFNRKDFVKQLEMFKDLQNQMMSQGNLSSPSSVKQETMGNSNYNPNTPTNTADKFMVPCEPNNADKTDYVHEGKSQDFENSSVSTESNDGHPVAESGPVFPLSGMKDIEKNYLGRGIDSNTFPKSSETRTTCSKDFKKSKSSVEEIYISESESSKKLPAKKELKCYKCKNVFYDMEELKVHLKSHLLEKKPTQPKSDKKPEGKYICDYAPCGKIFARREHWRRHRLIHSDTTPYTCEICGRGFKRSEHVKRHQSVHTKEKPFDCQFCDKKFTRSERLKRHLLKHSFIVSDPQVQSQQQA